MDYIHHFNKYKETDNTNLTKEQFNSVVNYIEERGKLKNTFKFYHMVYDYYKSLDGNYELQKDLMKEVKKEFRVSYVTIFSVLKYFKES